MKETFDNRLVPARCWYYLLDWLDTYGRDIMFEIEPQCEGRLAYLTFDQFWSLYGTVTARELAASKKVN